MAVTISNFTGKYRIAQDPDTKVMLADYITKYEAKYLKLLFGCELYESYVADPNTVRFQAITEPFCMDAESAIETGCNVKHRQYVSEGIDEMVKGFVYFHFVPDIAHKITTSGAVVNKNENSNPSDLLEVATTDRYNLSITTYLAIQYKIEKNETDYPEFKGVPLRYVFFGGAF